jgi:hypothetical protein
MMNETRVKSKFTTDPRFRPASKAQEACLNSKAELMLGGGSVGSLKTSTALIDGAV